MLVADLPWYDFAELREATDVWWRGIAKHLRQQGVAGVPDELRHDGRYAERWQQPELLLSQACGYDVLYDQREHIVPIATPCYAAQGCEGPRYRSFVVVRREQSWQTFDELRGRSLAINQATSHSGTNALRPQAAMLHQDGSFFGDVTHTGSHLASLAALHGGAVEVACIDAVVLALLYRVRPDAVTNLRAVACTKTALAPPYVTSAQASPELVAQLQAALTAAVHDPGLQKARDALLLRDFVCFPPDAYSELEDFEQDAMAAGYLQLPAPMRSPLTSGGDPPRCDE